MVTAGMVAPRLMDVYPKSAARDRLERGTARGPSLRGGFADQGPVRLDGW